MGRGLPTMASWAHSRAEPTTPTTWPPLTSLIVHLRTSQLFKFSVQTRRWHLWNSQIVIKEQHVKPHQLWLKTDEQPRFKYFILVIHMISQYVACTMFGLITRWYGLWQDGRQRETQFGYLAQNVILVEKKKKKTAATDAWNIDFETWVSPKIWAYWFHFHAQLKKTCDLPLIPSQQTHLPLYPWYLQ